METLTFESSENFIEWARLAVKKKDQRYNRAPVGKQKWIYKDGHVEETEMGKRGGTLLSNLSFAVRTGSGKMEHSRDERMIREISLRGGVVITINWGE